MYYDFVAHCRWPLAPLAEREPASWLWLGLRRMFPSALAAALMPNHLHLVAPTTKPEVEHERLRRLLGSFARSFDLGPVWSLVPRPKPLATADKILRQVRYVHLNPCRPCHIGMEDVVLADDPLSWEWSTHRDAMGAIVDPWVTARQIIEAARIRTDDPATWLHRYVSGDPSVAVGGTPTPTSATTGELDRAVLATSAAHRSMRDDLRRRGPARTTLLALGGALGIAPTALAEVAGMHPVAAVRRMRGVDRRAFDPALLCLGDERLLLRTDYSPPPGSRAVGLDAIQRSRRNG